MGCGERVRASCRAHPVLQQLRREDTDSGRTVTTHSPAPLGPAGAVPRLLSFDRAESTVHSQFLAPDPETKLTVRRSRPVTT